MSSVLIKLIPTWITPNTLTLARLLGAIVLLFLGFSRIQLGWLILLIICLILSDAFDGWLARSRGQITPLGAYLDPFADKMFALVVVVVLWSRSLVDFRLLLMALAVDVHVWLLPLLTWRRRIKLKLKLWPPPQIAANAWGKAKTGILSSGMGLVLLGAWLQLPLICHIGLGCIVGALFLGVMASIRYIAAWKKGAFL